VPESYAFRTRMGALLRRLTGPSAEEEQPPTAEPQPGHTNMEEAAVTEAFQRQAVTRKPDAKSDEAEK
jgi:hypothetical protein